MSNTLNIIVTEFKSVGTNSIRSWVTASNSFRKASVYGQSDLRLLNESTFGFTASDSYGSHFEDGWESLPAFLSDYPTPEKLKEHVLSTEAFSGFVDGGENSSGSIYIEFPENTDTATMTDEQLRALCEANGVRIFQSEDDGDKGRWLWRTYMAGEGSDTSFATEREAMVNAILELDLE